MSLYRIYRPLVFADIAGQDHIKTTLQNEITQAATVHAYLFSGPRAVGKTTTARIFSRAINCTKRGEKESEPCNDCDICAMILQNKSLDIIEIDAASHTGVDNVRENIIAAARVANGSLRYKVFIIDEVHMLSISAFNALLKLLEEPPSNVVFILATTELHKVPATIISRCQRFDFKKIPPLEMEKRLRKLVAAEKKEIDDDILKEVVRLSGGFERDADSLLGQLLALHDKKIDWKLASLVLPLSHVELVKELAAALADHKKSAALELIDRLIDTGVDLPTFINDVIDYFRDVLLLLNGAERVVKNEVALDEQKCALTKKLSSEDVLRIIDSFIGAQRDSRWFAIPQLPIEMAVVRSCDIEES